MGQDGVQLGADGVAEFALQVPHAVAALFQLEMAAVLLQLVIDGFGPVGVGSVDDAEGVAAQLRGPQHWGRSR